MCKTNIRIWDCFYHNCFGYRHQKNTKSPELFHKASTSYVSARQLHEASELPYVRERFITVSQNHLARIHANPLVEHTINSAWNNITRDKYKTSISILKPQDWSADTDYRMQKNEETSLNVQPLILKVMVGPVHRHVWHSPRTQNQSQHTRLPDSRIYRCYTHRTMAGPWVFHLIILHHYLTATAYLR